MASSRRNLCDDILRLIDEALADDEHVAAFAVVGGSQLRPPGHAAGPPRPSRVGSA